MQILQILIFFPIFFFHLSKKGSRHCTSDVELPDVGGVGPQLLGSLLEGVHLAADGLYPVIARLDLVGRPLQVLVYRLNLVVTVRQVFPSVKRRNLGIVHVATCSPPPPLFIF